MKLFLRAAALLCCISYSFAVVNRTRGNELFETVKTSTLVKNNAELVNKVRTRVYNRGCDINVCFTLDGSSSVGANNFTIEKEFVNLITAIVGADESNFAGTVFGLVNTDISPLTNSAADLILGVTLAPFPAAPVTFISAGLGFCFKELDGPELRLEQNRIVMLSDGFSNFGDLEGLLNPTAIAGQWRDLNSGNQFCAVGVGFSNVNALNDITGDPEHVLQVKNWPSVLDILDPLFSCLCPTYGVPARARLSPEPPVM